ncbi:Crp/Fnr family transcriptional regulator [Salinisphaera orenii]|nr:Crp/Fnr family transcriptional regulator [Salinisphaera orenii]
MHDVLERQYFLAGLSEAQRERLFAAAVELSLAPGQTLFHQGEPAGAFFVVTAGRVKLYRLSLQGDEKIMGLAGAHDSFAEGVLFMPEPRYPVNAQALEASRVVAIACADYRQMLQESFDTCVSVMGKLTARIQGLLDEVESLTLRDSRYRVINYLIELLPSQNTAALRLRLPAPKSVIAARLSIRAETFSRTLRLLAEEELIVLRGGRAIEVPDPRRLRRALYA